MQRLLVLLGATFVLVCNALFAQNCSVNPTFKNQDGTYDLTAGRTLVIDDGKSHNITITNNFSATSTICVTNGSTLNLAISNLQNTVAGATIYIDASSVFNLVGTNVSVFPFTINNYGTINQNIDITYQDGAIINNYGTYTTSRKVTFSNRIT